MKNLLVIIISITTVTGCSDYLRGYIDSQIKNTSSHTIQLKFYRGGVEDTTSSVILFEDESQIVLHTSPDEGIPYPTHISSAGFDSLVVTLDNRHATHYNFNTSGRNALAINFNENRNLFNINYWQKQVIENTRKHRELIYFYEFTEQDYLNAQ